MKTLQHLFGHRIISNEHEKYLSIGLFARTMGENVSLCVCANEQEKSKLIFMPSVHGAELKILWIIGVLRFCLHFHFQHQARIQNLRDKNQDNTTFNVSLSPPSPYRTHEKQIKTLASWKRDVNVQCLNICVYLSVSLS